MGNKYQDVAYIELCKRILEEGTFKGDRTGTGTLSVFGHQMEFDLQKGFPLLTNKKVPFGLVASELDWFLSGSTNIRPLLEANNHIWDEWAFKNWVESDEYQGEDMTNFGLRAEQDPEFKKIYRKEMKKFCKRILEDDEFAEKYGELGDAYGKQWRSWSGSNGEVIDQIANVIEQIKKNPDSRRLIVTAWNPAEVDNVALPPCHTLFQFYVVDNKLSCQLYQRSMDVFLGCPFNIASYSLLTHIIARECGLEVGKFVHTVGDAHIYTNHIEQVKEFISREPFPAPTLVFNEDGTYELKDYQSHPAIKAPVAV